MIFPKKFEDHEYNAVVDKKIVKLRLSDIKARTIILAFYPLDFTFVCPTEIIKLSKMYEEFNKLDTVVLLISADSVYTHLAWINTSVDDGGIGDVKWPMISDIAHKLSRQYKLFNREEGTVVRSTVILSSDLTVKAISATIDPIGRSSKELIRLVKAIQFNEEHGDICPVDFEGN